MDGTPTVAHVVAHGEGRPYLLWLDGSVTGAFSAQGGPRNCPVERSSAVDGGVCRNASGRPPPGVGPEAAHRGRHLVRFGGSLWRSLRQWTLVVAEPHERWAAKSVTVGSAKDSKSRKAIFTVSVCVPALKTIWSAPFSEAST